MELLYWSQRVYTDIHLGMNCLRQFMCDVAGDLNAVLQQHGRGKRIWFQGKGKGRPMTCRRRPRAGVEV